MSDAGFVDVDATEDLDVGDFIATLRTEFSEGDVQEILRATMPAQDKFDIAGPRQRLFELGIVAWSSPVPLTPLNIQRMRPRVADAIATKLDSFYERSQRALPNGSGGPSVPALQPIRLEANRATRRERQPSMSRSS